MRDLSFCTRSCDSTMHLTMRSEIFAASFAFSPAFILFTSSQLKDSRMTPPQRGMAI
eukprot:CAMPEP_0118937288 /NCGR_PEP_ID=MMETSP1169-20130426/22234_1 /TAXON_ID=36882 /ORGANISM="Pyramimonas obovata, Strain CCMP722" /LENGTH=56 /DNA_ID=CAMNT_0006880873 /DNA_START=259 /DNA_END=426 /DNA_ORIENTATION=-